MRYPAVLAVSLIVLGSCGAPGGAGGPRHLEPTEEAIEWQAWSPDAFERARREDRLVLVDVGIEGCTACRWMYEDTYRDPAVVRRVNERFVPVAVDADVQPDLGERYERWGWPATIVLTPDGAQVLALRGNRRPRNFVPILDALIARHAAGTLTDESAPPIAPAPVDDLGAICAAAVERVVAVSDTARGGYGGRMQLAAGAPVRWALSRGHATGEPARTAHALSTLEGYTRMIDPVWGGIFVAAGPDFEGPIPEKRTVHQAPVLAAFAEAHLATGDPRWLEAAADLDRYLREWMRAEDGTFFATQEDVAPSLPPQMSARDYYRLPDEARRQHGIPPIDHAVYTDLNALVIEAYVQLHRATGDQEHLEVARRTAEALLRTRQRPAGWMTQAAPTARLRGDDRMRTFVADARAFLKPQGPFGLALLALWSATGDARWLEAAQRLADGMTRLEDPDGGGFFASDPDPTAALLGRRKPVDENLDAARFLNRLGWATHDERLRARARRTLHAVVPQVRVERMGSRASRLARAIEEVVHGPVDFTVLGDADDPAARALFDAAVRTWAPRGVVRYEAPGVRYPDQGRAAMFVCTDDACSSPIFDPSEVAEAGQRMGRLDDPAPCAP